MAEDGEDRDYNAGLWIGGRPVQYFISTDADGVRVELVDGSVALVPHTNPDVDRLKVLPSKTPARIVPTVVTLAQARSLLRRQNLLDVVETAITGSGNAEMIDAWVYGNGLSRDSDMLRVLAKVLGFTDTQIDDLFCAAAEIEY